MSAATENRSPQPVTVLKRVSRWYRFLLINMQAYTSNIPELHGYTVHQQCWTLLLPT